MSEVLHSIRDAISLPFWAQLLALAFVALSPFVILKWRGKSGNWLKSDR